MWGSADRRFLKQPFGDFVSRHGGATSVIGFELFLNELARQCGRAWAGAAVGDANAESETGAAVLDVTGNRHRVGPPALIGRHQGLPAHQQIEREFHCRRTADQRMRTDERMQDLLNHLEVEFFFAEDRLQRQEQPGHVDALRLGVIQGHEGVGLGRDEHDLATVVTQADWHFDVTHADFVQSTGQLIGGFVGDVGHQAAFCRAGIVRVIERTHLGGSIAIGKVAQAGKSLTLGRMVWKSGRPEDRKSGSPEVRWNCIPAMGAPLLTMAPPLVLASTSRYRKELLARLGIEFTSEAPGVDEDVVKNDSRLLPQQVAELLAEQKARAVANCFPKAVVIGSDQLAQLGTAILGKPETEAGACAQLKRLAGHTHELVTAVCVIHPGGVERHTDMAKLTMRHLDDAAIARYVAADRPLDCAGSYKLESSGIALFERIGCDDHTAIVGLPLIWLAGVLSRVGYRIP